MEQTAPPPSRARWRKAQRFSRPGHTHRRAQGIIFAESLCCRGAQRGKVPQVYILLHQNLRAAQFPAPPRAVTRLCAGPYSGGFVVLRLHHE